VTDDDLLVAAVSELYSADPDEFTERRIALVAAARSAGDAAAAKQIGGLRKPTRSAWVVNRLAHTDSGLAAQLIELGDELRDAQSSLDGARMRELSVRRRELIDALSQQAFTAAGQATPTAALRDEVTSTFGAALADPQFAEQLQAGALVRPARPDGFGAGPESALTVTATPRLRLVQPARTARGTATRHSSARGTAGPTATAPAGVEAESAEARAKAAEERRQAALAEAEHRAADADQAAQAAADAESERQRALELIEEQLADARRELDQARLQARRARVAQRAARQALGRLQK
jgi:hypothetical protein